MTDTTDSNGRQDISYDESYEDDAHTMTVTTTHSDGVTTQTVTSTNKDTGDTIPKHQQPVEMIVEMLLRQRPIKRNTTPRDMRKQNLMKPLVD